MSKMRFYRKMDCVNNGKQLKILLDAGNDIEIVDLLAHPWTREELEGFIGSKPISECVNQAAPAVKRGEVDPDALEREEGIAMMLKDHFLIKRPLVEVDGLKIQGFKAPELKPYLGDWKDEEDVTTCKNIGSVGTNCATK